MTDNQIISFIIAAVACFFLYAGFDIMSGMASNGGTESFIASIGIDAHYKSMSRGVIDSRDVIYFLVVTATFLFLTREILARKK